MQIMDVLCASKNNNSTQFILHFLFLPLLPSFMFFFFILFHLYICLKRLWRDEIYRSFKWDASVSQFLHNSVSSEKLQQLKGKKPLLYLIPILLSCNILASLFTLSITHICLRFTIPSPVQFHSKADCETTRVCSSLLALALLHLLSSISQHTSLYV